MKLKLVIGITVENRGLKTLKDGQAFVLSRKIALKFILLYKNNFQTSYMYYGKIAFLNVIRGNFLLYIGNSLLLLLRLFYLVFSLSLSYKIQFLLFLVLVFVVYSVYDQCKREIHFFVQLIRKSAKCIHQIFKNIFYCVQTIAKNLQIVCNVKTYIGCSCHTLHTAKI